jgi:FixJ family two-component response regulator
MAAIRTTIHLVDDDESIRRALGRVLNAHGHSVASYASAAEFLAQGEFDNVPGCLVLDLLMPGMDGMALQEAVLGRLPVIILTGHADVSNAVHAMQWGAIDFLQKPVMDTVLLAAVAKGCSAALDSFARRKDLQELRRKLERLTPREREVLAWVVTGRRNKQVASELGTVEKTIKVHVMQKLEVDSLPALVRIADKMGMSTEACT